MSRTTRVATMLRRVIADTPEYEIYEYSDSSLQHIAKTKSNRAIAIQAMGEIQHRSEKNNSRLVYVSS
jgi:hypothetical protein